MQAPLVGDAGQTFVTETLGSAKPQKAIQAIQQAASLQDPRTKPLLGLLDHLGVSRCCRIRMFQGLGKDQGLRIRSGNRALLVVRSGSGSRVDRAIQQAASLQDLCTKPLLGLLDHLGVSRCCRIRVIHGLGKDQGSGIRSGNGVWWSDQDQGLGSTGPSSRPPGHLQVPSEQGLGGSEEE